MLEVAGAMEIVRHHHSSKRSRRKNTPKRVKVAAAYADDNFANTTPEQIRVRVFGAHILTPTPRNKYTFEFLSVYTEIGHKEVATSRKRSGQKTVVGRGVA